MPNTPKGFPYDAPGDAPDGAGMGRRLAEHLDDTQARAVAAGVATITLTNVASGTAAVVFPAGLFIDAPVITATVNSAAGGAATLVARVYNLTKDGCTVQVTHAAGSLVTVTAPVQWIAVEPS